jgi:hypothetical protein
LLFIHNQKLTYMGKVNILLIVVWHFCGLANTKAQSNIYQPIFSTHTQWNVSFLQYNTGIETSIVQKTEKDTTIQQQSFMSFNTDANGLNQRINVFLREEKEAGKVYIYENGEQFLLYDFSLKVGDIFKIKGLIFEVVSSEIINVQGSKRKKTELLCLNKVGDILVWIEGLGSPVAPLYYRYYADETQATKVTCLYKKSQLVYQLLDFPCPSLVGTKDSYSIPFEVVAYPNPTSDLLHISVQNNEAIRVELLDLAGHVLQQANSTTFQYQQTWQLAHLVPGVYILRLQTKENIQTKRIIKQ